MNRYYLLIEILRQSIIDNSNNDHALAFIPFFMHYSYTLFKECSSAAMPVVFYIFCSGCPQLEQNFPPLTGNPQFVQNLETGLSLGTGLSADSPAIAFA